MTLDAYFCSTFDPRPCGIAKFTRNWTRALVNFREEIGRVRGAAIDDPVNSCRDDYNVPVVRNLIINQDDPDSYLKSAENMLDIVGKNGGSAFAVVMYEPGIFGTGGVDNIVPYVKTLTDGGLITFLYLHTIVDDPSEYQKDQMQKLVECADEKLLRLMYPTPSAKGILRKNYGVRQSDGSKLILVPHGVRYRHAEENDRLEAKRALGIEGSFLALTTGFRDPGKGFEYGIRGIGMFLNELCDQRSRKDFLGILAGIPHPSFVKNDYRTHAAYERLLNKTFKDSKIRLKKLKSVDELRHVKWQTYDFIWLDTYVDDHNLGRLFTASNVGVWPYLNMKQIVSGNMADGVGSGRAQIATPSAYARDILNLGQPINENGITIGPRGILTSGPGEVSVEQIAYALRYLVQNEDARFKMDRECRVFGHDASWSNVVWSQIQKAKAMDDVLRKRVGRGVEIRLNTDPKLEERMAELVGND